MPRVLVVVALLMSAAACGGGAAPASPSAVTPATFTLSGTVTETAPTATVTIVGATLTITDGPNAGRSTTSGANGAYRFEALHPGDFTMRLSAPDYRERMQSIVLTGNQSLALQLEPVERRVTTKITGTLGSGPECVGYWDDPPYPTDPCSSDYLFDVQATGLLTAELSYTDPNSDAIIELYGAKNGQPSGYPLPWSAVGAANTTTVYAGGHYLLRTRKFSPGGGPPPRATTSFTVTLTYPQ